jgi:hypothetical protein
LRNIKINKESKETKTTVSNDSKGINLIQFTLIVTLIFSLVFFAALIFSLVFFANEQRKDMGIRDDARIMSKIVKELDSIPVQERKLNLKVAGTMLSPVDYYHLTLVNDNNSSYYEIINDNENLCVILRVDYRIDLNRSLNMDTAFDVPLIIDQCKRDKNIRLIPIL